MRRILPIILIVLLVSGGFLLYRYWFPSDQARIKQLLNQAAESASVNPDSSLFSKLGAVNKLLDLCADDIEILVNAPGIQRRSIRGRDQLQEVMTMVQGSQREIEISLRDLTVDVDESGVDASAQFIAQARVDRLQDSIYQEFRVSLVRQDGDWKIRKVEPLQALGL